MKNLIILLLFLISFLACNREYKQGEQSLIRASNLRIVTVEINGYKSNLILDSGAGSTILDLSFAKDRGIKTYVSGDEYAGIGGTSQAHATAGFELIILGDTSTYSAKALNLSDVRYKFHKSGYTVHGILGGDFLSRKGCVINYNTNTLQCSELPLRL